MKETTYCSHGVFRVKPEKIRVLHVLPWIAGGGVERRRALIAEYSDNTFEHRFFALRSFGANHARLLAAGATVEHMDMHRLKGLRPFKELLRIVRDYRPHIIHGAVFEGVTMASVVGRIARVPVIITEETSQATTRSWKGHLLFRTLCQMADRVVAISPQVEGMLRDRTRVPKDRIVLITNGVEPLDWVSEAERNDAKARYGLPETAYVLGTMSRIVDDSNKRVSDAIRSLVTLRERIPTVHLLVCGDGKDRIVLEHLVKELGLEGAVTFAGNLAEPYEGFSAMDVMVHAASHEGFGLAIAEAAFCGLPIVTTGVGGIAEIVVPEETGIFVPVGDPEAIAAAVTRLYEQPTLREAMGQAGRDRAMERFSAQRYVRDVEALYHQLLREKKVTL